MTKANIVLALFVVAALAFLGAWLIALNGDLFGGSNFNAWLAAGGFFGMAGFVVERIR